MKRQWNIKRTVKETKDGQNWWDRAYLLVLEIAQTAEQSQASLSKEASHANSDLCARIDHETSPNSNH